MANPEIDAYIAKAAPFAQPILVRLRAAFHRACPEVVESIKWGRAFFSYRGRMLAGAGAFKSHVRFLFWEGADPDGPQGGAVKLYSIADLPSDEALDARITKAMRQFETGARKPVRAARPAKPELVPPTEFLEALERHSSAERAFAAMPPSRRREYIEWILDAKRDETRDKRIRTAVEWLGEGKSLNWKYERGSVKA